MLRLLADEDFSLNIVRAVLDRSPQADIVQVSDVGLRGAKDPVVLEWAAQHRRAVLTHDVNTMTDFAKERIESGLPMWGLFPVPRKAALNRIIEDITMIVECSEEDEWVGQIQFLPFK